jgi:hypothetical protein
MNLSKDHENFFYIAELNKRAKNSGCNEESGKTYDELTIKERHLFSMNCKNVICTKMEEE